MSAEITPHPSEPHVRIRSRGARSVFRLVVVLLLVCVIVGFIGGLFISSERSGRPPAVVNFVGWTNVPGAGKHAVVSFRNTSKRRVFRFGYCEIHGEGITGRIFNFPRASVKVESEGTELLQVAVPATARGEVRFRFHVTVPRTFAQDAVEMVDGVLSGLNVNFSKLKEFHENHWALTCSATVER